MRERVVRERQVIGAPGRTMKSGNVSMGVKKDIRSIIILPTLSHTSEIWTWNAA